MGTVDRYGRSTVLGKQAFMNTKKLFMGNLSTELKKENSKECIVECGVVRSRIMDIDSSTQEEIRSHGNVDLEKDGTNQLGGQNK